MRADLLKVLTMVSEGTLEVEKSADLIEAMYKKEDKAIGNVNYDRRMFKVRVDSSAGDNVKVMTSAIISSLDNEMLGEIVTVDSANGDKVRVVIE